MTAAEIKIKKMNTPHRLSRLWRISAPLMLTYKGGNVPYFGPKFLYYDCIFFVFYEVVWVVSNVTESIRGVSYKIFMFPLNTNSYSIKGPLAVSPANVR